MEKAPIPKFEEKRICALEGLKLLDTATEERFDRITQKAVERFSVPISTITLVDKNREWFKSVQGLKAREGPRDISFCGHALMSEIILIIKDTLEDPRFADNPMVTGYPYIRFYAGIRMLHKKTGLPVGVFCIKDIKPRKLTLEEIDTFMEIANRAEIELNRNVA